MEFCFSIETLIVADIKEEKAYSPLITFLLQSRFNLFGCCSFKGVFAWDTLVLMSGQSGERNGDAGEGVGKIDGLAGPLISEADEFIDEVELLLETVLAAEINIRYITYQFVRFYQ